MNVVLITTVPLSLRFLRGHIQFLQNKGARVYVITSPSPGLDAFSKEHRVGAYGIKMQRRVTPWRDLVTIWKMVRCLRQLRPDIVHAHTPKAGLLGMIAALIARVPIRLYHIHGLPLMTSSGIKRLILRLCDSVACQLAHQVFCVSHSIKQAVESEGICRTDKMEVLANGTIDGIDTKKQFDPHRFPQRTRMMLRGTLAIPAGARVLGFVGRLVKDKGIDELLDAFAQLGTEFPDLHLLIVGPFEEHQPISSGAMETLAKDVRIRVVGFVEDPAPYYSIMDVLAFPTYREGFGLVAAEASAMEVPVVATQIPGCVDAVQNGVTAMLVPPRDAKALAAAVATYLLDSALRRRHGTAGRTRIKYEFEPEQIRAALWRRYLNWLDVMGIPKPEIEPTIQRGRVGLRRDRRHPTRYTPA
jgi:glycosyltransferase involved in cell wall biosynthesis